MQCNLQESIQIGGLDVWGEETTTEQVRKEQREIKEEETKVDGGDIYLFNYSINVYTSKSS